MNIMQLMGLLSKVQGALTPDVMLLLKEFFTKAIESDNPNEFVKRSLQKALRDECGIEFVEVTTPKRRIRR